MAAWQVYCLVSVLVYHQARDGCAGAPAGDNRSGAGDFSVALQEGAQRKFELFYPEFPGTTTTSQTTLQEVLCLDPSHSCLTPILLRRTTAMQFLSYISHQRRLRVTSRR